MNSLNEFAEFFSVLRIKKIESCGIKLFYNDKFIEEFISSLSIDNRFIKIKDKLSEKIKIGEINVGYTTSNIISYLYKSFKDVLYNNFLTFIFGPNSAILGFFCPEDKKINIVLDENTNIFGTSDNKRISNILLHELSHYYSNKYPDVFYNLCKKTILEFYIKILEKQDIGENIKWKKYKKDISFLAKNLIYMESAKENPSIIINKVINLWKDTLLKILNDEKKVKKIMEKLFVLIAYIIGKERLSSEHIKEFYRQMSIFYNSYKEISPNINIKELEYTLFGQEIIFPSEIIAVKNSIGNIEEIKELINSGL